MLLLLLIAMLQCWGFASSDYKRETRVDCCYVALL